MKQLETNIDYLTVTSDSWQAITGLANEVLRYIPNLENEREFHWMGYKGYCYTGESGHIAWGVKPGYGLVQMSGECSDRVMRRLDAFHLERYKCTRLDIAVTVLLKRSKPLVDEAIKDWEEGTKGFSAILKSNGEGGTLYIGSRTSDQFGRLYDKGAEIMSRLRKDDYPLCQMWRYEVEYKRSRAKAMRERISHIIGEGKPLNEYIIQTVYEWFLRRGVVPAFHQLGKHYNIVQVDTRITNTQKTMDWLNVQVRPAIARVAREKELIEILLALGIEAEGSLKLVEKHPSRAGLQLAMWGARPKIV